MKTSLDSSHQETMRFTKRALVCAAFVALLFICLLARLIYLQVIEHHFYATLSEKNIINIVPVKPTRGLIYDRNGILLAKNIPVYSLMIIPARTQNLKATIKTLSHILNLTPENIDHFYKNLKHYRRFQAVPLKDSLSETELDQFYVNQYRLPGAVINTNMMRYYPLGKTVSAVVGYVGRINANELATKADNNYTASDEIGKAGIEASEEKLLHGQVGAEEAEINARGKTVRILKKTPSTPGQSIYLTIDSKLQAFAEKEMKGKSGAVVAIAPKTGEVLALVTNPSFDPNPFVMGISKKAYQKLLEAQNHPLFNRAIRGLYAPGSTVKPFISAYALEKNVITPKTQIYDRGTYQVPNTKHVFHDWKLTGHGWVNDYKAIVVSCDTFFYRLATALGIKRLNEALSAFGFGSKTGINLPHERSGVLPTPEWKRAFRGSSWYTGDTVQSGIGQGYLLTTPLQLAFATATLAEHGKKMLPSLLLKTQLPNGDIVTSPPSAQTPIDYKNPTSWELPIEGMRGVIMSPLGTAWIFGKHAPFSAAAKTGTAQVYGHKRDEELSQKNLPKKLRNNHLFIVFAPIKNPKIALAVVVEHDAFADLIARKILDFYFSHLNDKRVSNATHSR